MCLMKNNNQCETALHIDAKWRFHPIEVDFKEEKMSQALVIYIFNFSTNIQYENDLLNREG
ncbi:hypothetical protein ACSVDA_14990 [Cytobacillus sp. Hm23]